MTRKLITRRAANHFEDDTGRGVVPGGWAFVAVENEQHYLNRGYITDEAPEVKPKDAPEKTASEEPEESAVESPLRRRGRPPGGSSE